MTGLGAPRGYRGEQENKHCFSDRLPALVNARIIAGFVTQGIGSFSNRWCDYNARKSRRRRGLCRSVGSAFFGEVFGCSATRRSALSIDEYGDASTLLAMISSDANRVDGGQSYEDLSGSSTVQMTSRSFFVYD